MTKIPILFKLMEERNDIITERIMNNHDLKFRIIELCKSFLWDLERADDENAVIALRQCLNEMKKYKPTPLFTFASNINEYYEYIKLMIPFKTAIDKHQYSRACCELSSLAFKEDILQSRIYCNIISILSQLLEK